MESLLPIWGGLAGSVLLAIAATVVLVQGLHKRRLEGRLHGTIRGSVPGQASGVASDTPTLSSRSAAQVLRGHALLEEKDARDLARAAAAAGYAPGRSVTLFLTAKLTLLLILPPSALAASITLSLGNPVLVTACALLTGLLVPSWFLARVRQSYLQQTRRGLSEALDLMVVCSEAGLGLDSAVERVAREMAGSNRAISLEFTVLAHELRVLPDRAQALTRMSERAVTDEVGRLTTTLSQTLRYGTPLAQAMRVLASELRRDRMQRLEERAAKLPALLVIPLILFILPCLFIVLVGPASIILSRTLGG